MNHINNDSFKVDIFCANRQRLIESMRKKLSVNDDADDSYCNRFIYMVGGKSETRYDSDHEPIFRQESYFWYLTGVNEPDCSLLIDIVQNTSCLFIPRLPPDYATVMGRIKTPSEWKEKYFMDTVQYNDEIIASVLRYTNEKTNNNSSKTTSSSLNNKQRSILFLMKGPNSDSGLMYEPPADIINNNELMTPTNLSVDTSTLFPILAECRVMKSPAELHLIRYVTEITSFAHSYVMRNMKVGMYEYQAESLFKHYCYYNYGCRLLSYTPICGCGPNASILHYGHSGEPNLRHINHVNDVCLMDMGAEYYGYGSDVTCSFPISGIFNEKQKPIYQAVLNAQIAVYTRMKPGVSWVDCHKVAEIELIKVLVDIGIVVLGDKTVEELVEARLGAVFQPHGLGHFLGIDTHDVGGYLEGHPERIMKAGLQKLRTARILQENMVLTVEPGLYFIDHLLDEAIGDESILRHHLNVTALNEYRGFGGIRLEDVVVVTKDGIINYTLCPRTMKEVESVMAGGMWPPLKDEAPYLHRSRLTETMKPLPSPPSS